jgi:hypothetical protein
MILQRLLHKPTDARNLRIASLAVLVGALGFFTFASISQFARGREGDFVHFYEAARAVLNNQDLYESGPAKGYIYPPLFALVLTPLALLSREAAGVLWTILNAAMLLAALLLLAHESLRRFTASSTPSPALSHPRTLALSHFFPTPILLIAALGALLNIDKVRAVLSLGQSDALTLLLIVLALVLQRGRPILSGACLGLAFNIKYQAIIFLPYLLLRRRFKEAASMASTATLGLFIGTPIFGWDKNLNYLGRAFAGLLEMAGIRAQSADAANIHSITWERSVSIVSASARLAQRFNEQLLTPAGVLLVASLALALGWWMLSRHAIALFLRNRGGQLELSHPNHRVALLEWTGLLVAVLVFSPQTTNRHMFLLTFATVVAATILLNSRDARSRWLLVAGLVALWLGLTLPPGGETFRKALTTWRAIAGPSWCVLIMYFTLLWAGLRTLPNETRP